MAATRAVLPNRDHARYDRVASFLAAAERLDLASTRLAFVGDTPDTDIGGASGVGLRTAWSRHGRSWPAALATRPPVHASASPGEVSRRLAAG